MQCAETGDVGGSPDVPFLAVPRGPPYGNKVAKRASTRIASIFWDGYATIPSSAPVMGILKGIQDAAEGAHQWSDGDKSIAPTYRHRVGRQGDKGTVDISVRPPNGRASPEGAFLSILWDQVRVLDDTTADVLLASLAQWLHSQKGEDAFIFADGILDYRGIKPKMKWEGPKRYRAGHHLEHRAAVARAMEQLDTLWLNITDVEIIELEGKRRKPKRLRLESKAVSISDRISQVGLGGGYLPMAWHYRLGQWAKPFLKEEFRQTALLAQESLQYDPYRQEWEKRLARYFTFEWRIRARQGNYEQPYRVATLLEAINKDPKWERPQRTRDRLEKALDRLERDAVIAGWEYERCNGEELPTKGWLPHWLKWTILVTAPPEIIEHYATIGRTHRGQLPLGRKRGR